VRALARRLVAADPERVTDAFPFSERVGKVLVDWRQNEQSRSMVAPYSLRATPWPLVSAPVAWDEVEAVAKGGDARSLVFSPRAVLERVAQFGDLFRGSLAREGSLTHVA
jgi:bifunctional non-homologous end joining protein LigD